MVGRGVVGAKHRILPQEDRFGAAAREVLAVAQRYLSTPVRHVIVAPGAEVVWDDCCGGVLYVRVVGVTPVTQANAALGTCALLGWAVTLGLGTVRCTDVVDDRGRAPRDKDLTEDALRLTQDAADLGQMLMCETNASNVSWAPQGPDGGCMSGEWTFDLRVSGCACPPVTP